MLQNVNVTAGKNFNSAQIIHLIKDVKKEKYIILCKKRGDIKMKKTILTLGLLSIFGGAAFADGNAFTPINFNDTEYGAPVTNSAPLQNAAAESEATGNGNIQNAILQLDNAQVDIRNDLLNSKTKFADVDAQYKLIRTERKTLKKQVSATEKRIKEIERAKEKIRKNML